MKKIMFTAVSSLLAFGLAQQDPADAAFVRVAHLSPNAEAVSVDIGGGGGFFGTDDTAVTDAEALSDLEYRDVTDYLTIAAGDYDVVVTAEGGSYQENVNFGAGGYYTIAALGLVAPDGLDQTEAPDDGGFLGFGGTGDTLGFRLEVLEEDVSALTAAQQPAAQPADPATGQAADPAQPVDPATGAAQPADPADPAAQPADPAASPTVADPALTQLVTARLVHAAPGVAQVSLVSVGAAADDAAAADAAATTEDANVLINNVPFGDISNYSDLDPAQVTNLQLRIEESPAATLGLGDVQLDLNTIYTMFVIGTPLEEGPLEVLLVGTTLGDQPEEEQQEEQAQDQQEEDQQDQQDDQQDQQDDQQDQQDDQQDQQDDQQDQQDDQQDQQDDQQDQQDDQQDQQDDQQDQDN